MFAAVGVHSGLPHGAATDFMSAFMAMHGGGPVGSGNTVPVIVFHGDRDTTIAPVNAEQLVTARLSVSPEPAATVTPPAAVTTRGIAGGRPYTRAAHAGRDGHTIAESWL